MKITYDKDVDAVYIQLIEGDHQCRTVSLNDDVALDFDERERLVGIEILDARRVIGKGKLPTVVTESLTTTAATPAAPAARARTARTPSKAGGRVRKAS